MASQQQKSQIYAALTAEQRMYYDALPPILQAGMMAGIVQHHPEDCTCGCKSPAMAAGAPAKAARTDKSTMPEYLVNGKPLNTDRPTSTVNYLPMPVNPAAMLNKPKQMPVRRAVVSENGASASTAAASCSAFLHDRRFRLNIIYF